MFGRKKRGAEDPDSRRIEAEAAVEKSIEEYRAVQALKPEVEATVKRHLKLQLENHFRERIWFAYRER